MNIIDDICNEFYKIFKINYKEEIGNYDYNLLEDKRFSASEIVLIIKNITNIYWGKTHIVKYPFDGEVTINNIVKFIYDNK